MANDIVNIAGSPTGDEVLGRITVHTPGHNTRALASQQVARIHTKTINIGNTHDKYDTRFDDPRYYTGDTVS